MEHSSKIHFQQEDLIRKNSLQQTLFLQALPNQCRIIITDEKKSVLLIEELSRESFINKEWRYVNLRFAETKILCLAESFIFVPKQFESTDADQSFASFLSPGRPVLQTEVLNSTIRTHYTLHDYIQAYQSVLSVNALIPSSNLLISHVQSLSKQNEDHIAIQFYHDSFELAYVKNEQFIFYNCFPMDTADDFNFYLLSFFQQFGLEPALTHFHLSGEVIELDEQYERLAKYSSHLHFSSPSVEFPDAEKDNFRVEHTFFLLSELTKCE